MEERNEQIYMLTMVIHSVTLRSNFRKKNRSIPTVKLNRGERYKNFRALATDN